MPSQLVELTTDTNRKSRCHNCNKIILGSETRLKINYPHPLGFRYYYICKECSTKLLNQINQRLI